MGLDIGEVMAQGDLTAVSCTCGQVTKEIETESAGGW